MISLAETPSAQRLDLRDLDPPEPMRRALEAVERPARVAIRSDRSSRRTYRIRSKFTRSDDSIRSQFALGDGAAIEIVTDREPVLLFRELDRRGRVYASESGPDGFRTTVRRATEGKTS